MVYNFQRMKMTAVTKVPKSPRVYAKQRAKLRELEFTSEEDEESPPEEQLRPEISVDEAAVIGEFVTSVAAKYGFGIHALWLILQARDVGATVEEALRHAKEQIMKEVEYEKSKSPRKSKKT